MLCRFTRSVKRTSYLDRAPAWYDTHTRVFYIFSLGRYHNKPIYCYGETNDLDAIEFHLKQHLPIYERILYTPAHLGYEHDFREAPIQDVAFEVRGFEDWKMFTCEDIQAIVNSIDIRASVDWE